MSSETVLQTRIKTSTKEKAEHIVNRLGFSLTDAVRMFLSQIIEEEGLPFRPSLKKNAEKSLIKALEEIKKGKHSQAFESVEELMEELNA